LPADNGLFIGPDQTIYSDNDHNAYAFRGDTISSINIGNNAAPVTVRGHVSYSGTAPSIVECGGSAVVHGQDGAGSITVGSGAVTSCVLRFNIAFAATPYCTVTPNSNVTLWLDPVSNREFRVNSSGNLSGKIVYYHCQG